MIYNFVLRGKEIRIDDVVLCYVFWDSYYRSHFLRQLLIQQKRLYGLDGMKILTISQAQTGNEVATTMNMNRLYRLDLQICESRMARADGNAAKRQD